MRPLKFRVWDKDLKKFVTGDGYDYGISLTGDLIYEIFGYDEGDFNRPSIDYILMQYTGLKDKNGKEIYEGDIMLKRCPCCTEFDEYGVVVFDCGSFKFQSDLSTKCNHDFAFRYQEYEIIGNIYENPDLLVEVK